MCVLQSMVATVIGGFTIDYGGYMGLGVVITTMSGTVTAERMTYDPSTAPDEDRFMISIPECRNGFPYPQLKINDPALSYVAQDDLNVVDNGSPSTSDLNLFIGPVPSVTFGGYGQFGPSDVTFDQRTWEEISTLGGAVNLNFYFSKNAGPGGVPVGPALGLNPPDGYPDLPIVGSCEIDFTGG